MKNNISDLVHDVVASPLGDVIASVGEGVAQAQQALDEGSLAKTLEIYAEGGDDALRILREIGYRPTFYALPETTGEINVSMHLGSSLSPAQSTNSTNTTLQPAVSAKLAKTGRNLRMKPRIYATPVDAGYANRYGYKANISAKLTFKIVPVPAPEGADELRVLPNFLGISIKDNRLRADSLGLDLRVVNIDNELIETPDEDSIVTAQDPQSNPSSPQFIRLGEEVVLTIG